MEKWWGHADNLKCVEFMPDGKELMSGSDDGSVIRLHLEPVQNYSVSHRFEGLQGTRRGFFVSPFNQNLTETAEATFFCVLPCSLWTDTAQSGVCYLILHELDSRG